MKIRNFRPIDLPIQFREYYTKYPHGMTIFESLIEWVNSNNNIIENINDLNYYMDDFINQWQGEMREEVDTTLTEWKNDGFFDVVISEVFGDKVEELENSIEETELIVLNTNSFKRSSWVKRYDEESETYYHLVYIPEPLELSHELFSQGGKDILTFAQEENALVAVNWGVFNDGNTLGGVSLHNGNIISNDVSESVTSYTLAIKEGRELGYFAKNVSAETIRSQGFTESSPAYIPLIEDYQIRTDLLGILNTYVERHPRSNICQMENGGWLFMTCGGRGIDGKGMTMADNARVLSNIRIGTDKVKFAMALDGGGSAQLVVNSVMVNRSVGSVGSVEGKGLRKRPNSIYIKNPQELKKSDISIVELSQTLGKLKQTLDDLQGASGTFTPRLFVEGQSIPGVEYNKQEGHFIRVGNLVYINYHIGVSTKGSSSGVSGNLRATGFPFYFKDWTPTFAGFGGYNTDEPVNMLYVTTPKNTRDLDFRWRTKAGATARVKFESFKDSFEVYGSFVHEIATDYEPIDTISNKRLYDKEI